MATISQRLEELSRKSAASLLRNITINFKDFSRLSPTIIVGIGQTGHQVLSELKKYVQEYSLFVKEHYNATRAAGIFTSELLPDAIHQSLSFLSLPYIDGSAEVAGGTLEGSEILSIQTPLPALTADVLSQNPELALWLYPETFLDVQKSPARTLIAAAIDARMRLYFSQEAVIKFIRDAIQRAVVLRPELSHSGLLQGVGKGGTIKIFVVASTSHPCSAVIPDVVARTCAIARESRYDVKIGIVLVEHSTENETDQRYRNDARRVALAAVNTITRSYTKRSSAFLNSGAIFPLLPPVSPVSVVYVLSDSVAGRQLSAEDSLRAATLLLFHSYLEKYPLPFFSNRIFEGDPILSGFGTASVIFPWRFIKTFSLQFVLGKLYRYFESGEYQESQESSKKTEIPLPDFSKDDSENAESEKTFATVISLCLQTNRLHRNDLLREYLDKIRNKIVQIEQQKKQLAERIKALEEQREKVFKFYKKIGYIALGAMPPLCGALAALLAEPASLFDYLEMPALIAVGSGIGTLLGGGILLLCTNVLAKRAAQKIDESIRQAEASLSTVSRQEAAYKRFESSIEALWEKVSAFFLLHDELRTFEALQRELPIDETQVPSTTVYLLVDKLCPPSKNTNLLYEYLRNSDWLNKAFDQGKQHYQTMIAEKWGKELWNAIRSEKASERLEETRANFVMALSESLAAQIDTYTHIGEGIITRMANLITKDSSRKDDFNSVLGVWEHLSAPSLPMKSIDPSRIRRFAFVNDDTVLLQKYLPDFLHNAKSGLSDPRMIMRFEFVHGVLPSELFEHAEEMTDDDLAKFLNWLDFSFQREVEPIELTLACHVMVGTKDRLAGFEAIKAEEVYSLEIVDNFEPWEVHREPPPTRYYVDVWNGTLQTYSKQIDSMCSFFAQLGRPKLKTIPEYSKEIHFVPKDPALWSIVLEAANNTQFFLQSSDEQLRSLTNLGKNMILQSQMQLENAIASNTVNWEVQWTKEAVRRWQKDIPSMTMTTEGTLGDQQKSDNNSRDQQTEKWHFLAESLLESYVRETARYLLVAKALYLACISDAKYGLKRIRVLVLHADGEKHTLGFSIRDLTESIKRDQALFRGISSIVRRWAGNNRIKSEVNRAMQEITKQKELWEKPFSYWLS